MTTRMVGKITLVYPPDEQDTMALVAETCKKALQWIGMLWGLGEPARCRIYIMTSWRDFIVGSAPGLWKIYANMTLPMWQVRARRMWPYSAAWTLHYGRHVTIGIKPPHLLAAGDRSIGLKIFVPETNPEEKIRHVTCHELVHACSVHLRLPMWLNEGIAMLTVDRLLGLETIRRETLELIRETLPKAAPPTYREMSRMDGNAIAYQTARGYWLVRYLEEKQPGFWKDLFGHKIGRREIEKAVAQKSGLKPESLWAEIDAVLLDGFGTTG